MIKKRQLLFVLVIVIALMLTLPVFVACTDTGENNGAISITLNTTNLQMQVGDNQSIFATSSPDTNARNQLTWVTSDATVATISRAVGQSVQVAAIAEGTATITATLPGTYIAHTITITVSPAEIILVTGVTLASNASPVTVIVGDSAGVRTLTISANVLPANATNRNSTWSTYPSGILSLNQLALTSRNVSASEEHVGQIVTITVVTECGGFSASIDVEIVGAATE